MTVSPGSRIGRYEIRALLGAGGMGEVYRAWDHDLERDIAIKILRDGAGERRFTQEAKAASALHHPNIAHVYEIGSHDDLRFIAMELIEGETLRARLDRGAMTFDEVLEIGDQIASALAAAHKQGIVHRDIKPDNMIITTDGYAKVLDFGLAKLREVRGEDVATLVKTSPGVAMGTLGYMAPEQIVGGTVTPAADVFSLGCVLYEMVTGRRTFSGSTTTDVVSAILTKEPRPIGEIRPDIPPKLSAVIAKSLAKDVDQRYQDAAVVHGALREISRSAPRWQATAIPERRQTAALRSLAALVVVAVIVGAVWMFLQRQRRADAIRQVDVAERLVGERKLAEAYDVAVAAAAVLPDDTRLRDIIARTSDRFIVESEPPHATVFLQRFKGPPQRERMGVTPLTIQRLPRGEYLLTIEKRGFAPAVRPISNMPLYLPGGQPVFRPIPPVRMRLGESSAVPKGMVFVEGGPYRLGGYQRPSDRLVELRDFVIDRCEVSNAEFEEFIRDGGYRRPELWKHRFLDRGNELTFDQAMARFRDTTGLPGPRGWSGGVSPSGQKNHPVTDVSWYEAAAFAEWKGKKLPTVYQWEKAARPPLTSSLYRSFPWGMVAEGVEISDRANFLGKGTMPVASMPFGASPWGAVHMAGNVSEWCRNPHSTGYAARGGSWKDATYSFGQTAALPAFYSAPTLGFRCVSGGGGDEGDFGLSSTGFNPVYKAVDDPTFETFRRRYDYPRTPLNARVVERVETADWTREKITYESAGKLVPAYLYLPKRFPRPLQVIYFAPAGDVVSGIRSLPQSIEVRMAPHVRSGRAIFSVEHEGFFGRPRPADWEQPDRTQAEYVDEVVAYVTEVRRGLDYLETRKDLDLSRLAFIGLSAGGGPGVFVTAVESRFRSVMFVGTGIGLYEPGIHPAANRIHFIPRIRAPKLMLHGRYDEDTSLKSEAEPMFRLLSEPKRLEIFEGGHSPPLQVSVIAATKWLDETMGAVQ